MPKSKHRKSQKRKSTNNRKKMISQRNSADIKKVKLQQQLQSEYEKSYRQDIIEEQNRRLDIEKDISENLTNPSDEPMFKEKTNIFSDVKSK